MTKLHMKSNAIAHAMLMAIVCLFGYGRLSAQTQTQTQEEILRPGDQIQLRISGVPPKDQAEISGLYTVDGEGKIRLTHIKSDIQAKGLRPSVLAKTIETHYTLHRYLPHQGSRLTSTGEPPLSALYRFLVK